MGKIKEKQVWEEDIYLIETTDPVLGGENGVINSAPTQLANRTAYLKQQVDLLASRGNIGQGQHQGVSIINENSPPNSILNDLIAKGIHSIYNLTQPDNILDIPIKSAGTVETMAYSDEISVQTFTTYSSPIKVFRRIRNNRQNTPWVDLTASAATGVSQPTVIPSQGVNVAVLTGKIKNDQVIPLPSGFEQRQCKWIVTYSMPADDLGLHGYYTRASNFRAQTSFQGRLMSMLWVYTDTNRRVNGAFLEMRLRANDPFRLHSTTENTAFSNPVFNYMIIGVK